MVELATQYGRYGYRRITAMLRRDGWIVNHKRVQRLWRREGLKVPSRQPKRRRLWLNDGLCIRLRPRAKDHVWSYDFVSCRTREGRAFRPLTIMDEFTRECLAIEVARKLNSKNVLDVGAGARPTPPRSRIDARARRIQTSSCWKHPSLPKNPTMA